ncbi:MAG: hypothetical protein ACFFAO_18505 [Candidatus Hermodarchaeota archaeon]
MNSLEKLIEINIIIHDYKSKKCPYCHKKTQQYFEGKERKNGCYNHEEGDLEINLLDYLNAIEMVIRWGEIKPPQKHKEISEFF